MSRDLLERDDIGLAHSIDHPFKIVDAIFTE